MTSGITHAATKFERIPRCVARLCVAVSLAATGIAAASPAPPTVDSYGAQEPVRILGDTPLTVTATLAPDSQTSTLRVERFKYIPQASGLVVDFTVAAGGLVTLQEVTLQRPLLKDLHVDRRDGSVAHVPVVALDVCLGQTQAQVELQLHRRNDPAPAMKLGAPALAQLDARVDPGRSFTSTPGCATKAPDTGR